MKVKRVYFKSRKVELEQAWTWMCDCGKRNWAQSKVIKFTPEEEANLNFKHFMKDAQTGELILCDFVIAPSIVFCYECLSRYETAD